ncbi:uncharacterized protein N7482_006891 [Penicillium canariense]|uniref:Uncharacterized protein n=1 Tax=Penicillium canariense TaxID=189055 RepID=A0A9W9LIL2_9EURO|nr:uncharacterized protein N7482_006891 [Penicillium canariense]KAJ5159887.1 hypothetical protein N7482_006891 [Penicillium canariense]
MDLKDVIRPQFDRDSLELCKFDWLHKKAYLGEEHEDSLSAAFTIAEVLSKGKRHKQALGWYRFVFLTESVKLGMDHLKTLEVRDHIADVLRALGRGDDANRWEVPGVKGCVEVK